MAAMITRIPILLSRMVTVPTLETTLVVITPTPEAITLMAVRPAVMTTVVATATAEVAMAVPTLIKTRREAALR
jgi:hypothetical protein